jgi:ribosomal protein S18 acetylase RimI-like enzyme
VISSRESRPSCAGDRVAGVYGMSREHIEAVVSLHQTCFPDTRSSLLGPMFLRAMYDWFLTHRSGLSIVFVDNGKVVGFLTGVTGGYGRRMFHDTWPVIACCLVMRPGLWLRPNTFKLWRSYLLGVVPRRRALNKTPSTAAPVVTASVASIAVLPEARGKGIGRALLADFEGRARKLGARKLQLTVEAANVDAQQVYEKTGWQRLATGEFGYSYTKVFTDPI